MDCVMDRAQIWVRGRKHSTREAQSAKIKEVGKPPALLVLSATSSSFLHSSSSCFHLPAACFWISFPSLSYTFKSAVWLVPKPSCSNCYHCLFSLCDVSLAFGGMTNSRSMADLPGVRLLSHSLTICSSLGCRKLGFSFPLILCLAQQAQKSTKEREEAGDCPHLPLLAIGHNISAEAELIITSGLASGWGKPLWKWGQVGWDAWE